MDTYNKNATTARAYLPDNKNRIDKYKNNIAVKHPIDVISRGTSASLVAMTIYTIPVILSQFGNKYSTNQRKKGDVNTQPLVGLYVDGFLCGF